MATLRRRGARSNVLVLLLGAAILLNYVDRGAIGVAAPLDEVGARPDRDRFRPRRVGLLLGLCPGAALRGLAVRSLLRLSAAGARHCVWAASTLLMGFIGGFALSVVLRDVARHWRKHRFPGQLEDHRRHVPAERRGLAKRGRHAGLALGPAVGTLGGGSDRRSHSAGARCSSCSAGEPAVAAAVARRSVRRSRWADDGDAPRAGRGR